MNDKDKELLERWYEKYYEITSHDGTYDGSIFPSKEAWYAAYVYKETENKKLRIALNVSLKTILELWEMPDVVHLDDHGEAINLIKETLQELESK
jgi:hypothetical protein